MISYSTTKVIKSIKKAFGKSICNICLSEAKVVEFDSLEVCLDCLEKIKAMRDNEPFKISKEQMPGGIKDEL